MIRASSCRADAAVEREIARVADALAALRVPAEPGEYDIHGEIAAALAAAGLCYDHEYRLGPRCRVDFRVGRIGIEVKKGRPVARALRDQLARYLAFDALEGIVVVAQKSLPLPAALDGKPVRLVSLNRLWGVALP